MRGEGLAVTNSTGRLRYNYAESGRYLPTKQEQVCLTVGSAGM